MKPEDKQLLLKDLCARLPYGIIGAVPHYGEAGEEVLLQGKITSFNGGRIKFEYLPDCTDDIGAYNWVDIDLVKPYLRPMSSMTEEEEKEYNLLANRCMCTAVGFIHLEAESLLDWLNKKMFDFRGLIDKDLALSTETFNPYKD